jgi:hypothetical protein
MLSYSWVQRSQGDPGILIVHYDSQRIQREGEYVTNRFVSKTVFKTSLTLGCRVDVDKGVTSLPRWWPMSAGY